MDCTGTRGRIDAYLDQELDLPAVVALDEHLATLVKMAALEVQQIELGAWQTLSLESAGGESLPARSGSGC